MVNGDDEKAGGMGAVELLTQDFLAEITESCMVARNNECQ